MTTDLEKTLRETMWLPRDRREQMINTLSSCTAEGRELLAFALATNSVPGVEFWKELCTSILPADPERRFTLELIKHGITVAGARTVRPTALREAFLALKNVESNSLPHARAAFLALGGGVSLSHAHGIYVTATRKAQKALLPKEPPHLGGPVPELTVFETVEVALTMARLALSKKPHAEGSEVLESAEAQLAWARGARKKPTPITVVPATSKPKGPGFALARAALMEARNVDHVSARGTSIKSAVMWGLELGEEWWLSEPSIDRLTTWRLDGEWSELGAGLEPQPTRLDGQVLYVREDVWEQFLERARVDDDDALKARLADWRNPSKVRPRSLQRNH